jgi:hypothetical protein
MFPTSGVSARFDLDESKALADAARFFYNNLHLFICPSALNLAICWLAKELTAAKAGAERCRTRHEPPKDLDDNHDPNWSLL